MCSVSAKLLVKLSFMSCKKIYVLDENDNLNDLSILIVLPPFKNVHITLKVIEKEEELKHLL